MPPVRALVLSLLALLLVSCATPPVSSVWTDPAQVRRPYQRLLVLGVSASPKVRRAYEDNFVRQLVSQGLEAQAGHDLIADRQLARVSRLTNAIARARVDGVILTHLVAEETPVNRPPARLSAVPDHYHTLVGYFSQLYAEVSDPGYYSNPKGLRLEANLYDARQERLVWSGRSRLLDPDSDTTISQVIGEIIDQMARDGAIRPAPSASQRRSELEQ